MLSNYWLSLLAILCFTSFTSTYAELAEWALYKDDGSHPSLPFDEKALIAVLDPAHSKRSPPVSLAESTTDPNPNFATLNRRYIGPNPNGQCPKPLYSDKEDDRRCDRRFAGPVTDQSKLYAAKSTTCASTITRRLNCQLCYGFRVDNPSEIKTTDVRCGATEVCTQESDAYNKWGNLEPESICVSGNSIIQVVAARGTAVREFCSKKFTFPKARGSVAGFHAYVYDQVTGLRVTAKWMYLKISGGYIASARNAADWETNANLGEFQFAEMCFYPFSTAEPLEMDWTVTIRN
ncbi:hypothetical protein PtrSN002B_008429 [Pyrenophora tritici-repentis]|uniref:Uncharacterized protein n=2 Tax=Pyrenophora tritici-repentis TaxID=45151 RepID=A0A2W1H8Z1_9PLEO|nr:uncharacterized protein PTRG_07260 [Pyrenophora tritici-repentis Pt-1C-BFP]KAA8614833.1 hypothetical protein PtrV1_11863 [Pyrenophora tritici-repentis]EDU50179.1 predicted protein [Pyrenophora tritici-repentis Pt-1C-BFP]KAF7444654.1 hypothetical protein A1F99_112070 [Pyrenophora tritici-repentis]KAF7564685.1 hypothetical protein PtrM4_041190 [Pyrenophora tritici-repentis]KAG9378900.1 hypothetical protein A1F94_010669 [Pyrenophora tritici-repentis]